MNEAAKRVRKRFGLGVCFATLKELEGEVAREKRSRKRGKDVALPPIDRYLRQVYQDMLALGVIRLVLNEDGSWEVTRTQSGAA